MTKASLRSFIAIAVACGYFATATAATQTYVTSERAIEATISGVVLPSGPGSTLVVTPCAGCKPLSLPATASTTYFLKRQQVSLADLKKALAGKTDVYLSVFQSTKTGALTRVVAALDAPAPVKQK